MTEEKSIPASIKNLWANFAKQTANAIATPKKKKPQGKMLWDSSSKGTYVKKKHGDLK
jgi:hypothetical protein